MTGEKELLKKQIEEKKKIINELNEDNKYL